MPESNEYGARKRDPLIAERVRATCPDAPAEVLLSVECLANLLRTHTLIHERLTDVLEPMGLSMAKLNVLLLLTTAENGALPMSHIGMRMAVTCANITKLVDGLESAGHVRRKPCTDDRRSVLAVITSDGCALLRRILPGYVADVHELWNGMDANDCLDLIHLLTQLREGASGRRSARIAETDSTRYCEETTTQ